MLGHFEYDKSAPLGVREAGVEDFITPEIGRAYAAGVSEPKQFKLYDAPHALNAEALRDRIAFLVQQLRLIPVPEKTLRGIPQLFQPPEPK